MVVVIKLIWSWKRWIAAFAALAATLALMRDHASAAVTLESFTAEWQGNQVVLNWTTASELDNLGFNVLRGPASEGPFTPVSPASPLIPANCPGQVICSNPDYTYTDATVNPGQAYWYQLQSISLSLTIENHAPPICAIGAAAPCAPPTPTGTATETDEPPQPAPPTSTGTATATAPASQGGGIVALAPTATASQPPTSAAASNGSGQTAGQATATADAQLARIGNTQAAAQTIQSGASGAGSADGEAGQPGEPEPDESSTIEAGGTPTATASGIAAAGGLPAQFTFPTATLAATPTATNPSVQGSALGETGEQAGNSWLAPGVLPYGLRVAAALLAALLGLVVLPVTGYFLWHNARR